MPEFSPVCKVCGTPLSGLRAVPPRVLRGVRRNPKNPNFCNICSGFEPVGVGIGDILQ